VVTISSLKQDQHTENQRGNTDRQRRKARSRVEKQK